MGSGGGSRGEGDGVLGDGSAGDLMTSTTDGGVAGRTTLAAVAWLLLEETLVMTVGDAGTET